MQPLSGENHLIAIFPHAGTDLDIACLRVMMISLLEFTPTPKKRAAALEILGSVEAVARLKDGCVSCGLYEGHSAEREILYVELWQSKEEFYAHIRSDLYFRVLAAMELAAKKPKLAFHELSGSTGMELIRSLRGQETEE